MWHQTLLLYCGVMGFVMHSVVCFLSYIKYVFFVTIQVVGCVFLQHLHVNFCWLVQLLGIACLKKLQRDNTLGSFLSHFIETHSLFYHSAMLFLWWLLLESTTDMDVNLQFDDQCKVPVDEAGLLWDGICFAFLLVQKRVFSSYYFQHLVTEIRAQQELASRYYFITFLVL